LSERSLPSRIKGNMVDTVTSVFSAAFQNDPLYSWLIPDELARRSLLPLFFNFRVRYGLYYGEVHVTSPAAEGAAIWIPHTQTNMTRWKMIRSGALRFIRKADQVTLQRLKTLGAYADDLHRQHAPFPHWHLSPIAVCPENQGQGHGRILMKSMLDRLDREFLPCFLETQTPVNVTIYEKYHFTIKHQGKIPGTDIPHWVMLREPK